MILKRMNYMKLSPERLAKGKYKNYEYEIWNRSGVPAAYIMLPIDISSNKVLKSAIELEIVVHGGITFTGSLNCHEEDVDDYWIGWDYGHAGDYMNLPGVKLSGQKWTTRKIYKEVKNVIRQLISLKIKHSIVTSTETNIWMSKEYEVMKKSIIQKSLEVLLKRVEEAKQASEKDPYVDAYVLSAKLIQELIEILKSNNGALAELQLYHWIERQEYAGTEASIKNQIKGDINSLDSILKKEESNQQMTIDDFLDEKEGIKEVENPTEETKANGLNGE